MIDVQQDLRHCRLLDWLGLNSGGKVPSFFHSYTMYSYLNYMYSMCGGKNKTPPPPPRLISVFE